MFNWVAQKHVLGNPVAVYPDDRLRSDAETKG